jgi:hypothetical protein
MVPPERRKAQSSDPGGDGAVDSFDQRASGGLSTEPRDSDSEFVSVSSISLPPRMRVDLEDAPFWKEVAAFAKMPQSALDPYFGKFVAVYNGNIVDSDVDEGELALRFYRTFGYVPVYIHEVGIEDNVIDLND